MRGLSPHLKKLLNAALRLVSLATKLALTLYLGRYLSLEDLGLYGVVNGAVIILMTILGARLDYMMSRELVDTSPKNALLKMRDQAVFCIINYGILAAIMFFVAMADISGVSSKILFFIYVLSVLENFAAMTFSNQVAMGHPMQANVFFFIRSGLWVFPVVGLGVLMPQFRNSDFVFEIWAGGIALSIFATFAAWRSMPWHVLFQTSIDWEWLKKGIRSSFFIWLGAIGTTAGFFIDRFIVAHNLNMELAGVVTFYSSFTGAMYALIDSGIISFAYPKLISLYRTSNQSGFKKEIRHLIIQVTVAAAILGVVMGGIVPVFGAYLKGPVFMKYASTFWMMLFAMWIREIAQTFYYILFARHQDRAIWLGDLLFLLPAFGCNAVLVPLIGFQGVGYGALIAQGFIFIWRLWHVRFGRRHKTGGLSGPIQAQNI